MLVTLVVTVHVITFRDDNAAPIAVLRLWLFKQSSYEAFWHVEQVVTVCRCETTTADQCPLGDRRRQLGDRQMSRVSRRAGVVWRWDGESVYRVFGNVHPPWTSARCTTPAGHVTRCLQVTASLSVLLKFDQYSCGYKKVKASHTRYWALGPELIPVYRQSACRWL